MSQIALTATSIEGIQYSVVSVNQAKAFRVLAIDSVVGVDIQRTIHCMF